MAHGNTSNFDYLWCRLKNTKKEEDAGYIQVTHAKTEKIEQCGFIEGELVSIKFTEKEWEGKLLKGVKIGLKDGNSFYVLDIGESFNSRNLLNKLLNAKEFNDIKISFFGKKDDWKNISVMSNGVKLEYLFSKEDTATMVDIIKDKNGVVVKTDYSDVNDFLKKKVNEIIVPRLKYAEATHEAELEKESEKHYNKEVSTEDMNPDNTDYPAVNDGGKLPF